VVSLEKVTAPLSAISHRRKIFGCRDANATLEWH